MKPVTPQGSIHPGWRASIPRRSALLCGLAVAAGRHARAAPPPLLAQGQLVATTAEQTPPRRFAKPAPWRLGVSFAGDGNTWISQMLQELRFEAASRPAVGSLTLKLASWDPRQQADDVAALLAQPVDALIIGPISQANGAPLIERAAAKGIPVVTIGAYGRTVPSTVELMAGGRAFGREGGQFLRRELGAASRVWALRGVQGVDEEAQRYTGFRAAIDGSGLEVSEEHFGDWSYAKARLICERLLKQGAPVDGIWSSGADMTHGCVDAFQAAGRPLVPITGEANNGFLRLWKAHNLRSIAPTMIPGLGAAAVRAACALLEGQPLYRSYFSLQAPIDRTQRDALFRPELSDGFWLPSSLPESEIRRSFKR